MTDEAAVRQVIDRYEQALASLDPAAVRAVYPTVNVRALATQMAAYSSLRNDIQVARVQLGNNGQTALVTGSLTSAPVLKATGREIPPQRRPATIQLRKTGDTWLIQDVRFPLRPGDPGIQATGAEARPALGARAGQADGAVRRGRQ
jgi:ketosteroid isomerase-like protein